MFLRLLAACRSKAGGAVAAFPGKDKAGVGMGGRLASYRLTTVLSFEFWFGMEASFIFYAKSYG